VSSSKKIRVLVAKPGLDGHDRGAKIVARALRDAGMEVIYTGLRQTPEMVVRAALDEGVNALFPRIMELLKAEGANDILVVGGGIIPEDDIADLKKAGISEIFGPGTRLQDIVDYIRANVKL
jgi:methylmalonyl-CoA mutase C-terminal domain/subunit